MRILFLLCVVVLFSQCCGKSDSKLKAEPIWKSSKGPVTKGDYRQFFAGAFGYVKRVDPRELELTLYSSEAIDLSDSILLPYFTPADILFMRKQQLTKHKKDLSDYFRATEFVSAQEADSLFHREFGDPFKSGSGFHAFSRPLFSIDKSTVLLRDWHEGGNYDSQIRTAIWHWDGKHWKKVKILWGVTS
jgi:hypothetical protein